MVPYDHTTEDIIRTAHYVPSAERGGADPTRPGYDGALQLHSNLNIPPVQGEELSDDIDIVGIPALIRIFTGISSMDRYKPNVFVYATGSFNLTLTPILLQPPWRSRKRPPYYKRCPGEAPPSLTFQGAVIRSGGAMNRGATLMHYDFRI
ncbi:hypothetical protein V8E54_009160 [Elaphomyces granulatus]